MVDFSKVNDEDLIREMRKRKIQHEIAPASKRQYEAYSAKFEKWLEGATPSPDKAREYLVLLRQDKKQNYVAIVRNALCWKYGFNLASESIEIAAPHYLKIEQIKMLMEKASPLMRAFIAMQYDTGARASEVLGMRLGDLDWTEGTIAVVRKGGDKDVCVVSDTGLAALREWLKTRKSNSDCLFLGFEYPDIAKKFNVLSRKTGIRCTSHMLRHSRAVHLRDSGVEIEKISQILGHKSPRVTQLIYLRRNYGDLRKEMKQW